MFPQRAASGGIRQMMNEMADQMDAMMENNMLPAVTSPDQPLLLPTQLQQPAGTRGRFMPIDVVEEKEHFTVTADLPGVAKDLISVQVDQGNTLRISVKDSAQAERPAGEKWYRNERSVDFRPRELRMPENADLSNLNAKMDNGVLTMHIKKSAHHEPSQVAIQ
ncbi:hypothetical protein CYMTET_52230 [Cymbomonas tetramitiformis]|uniref:SHSP domain-containing protein n=1 Tax=Cymbomonas tetramitiformis TaxID=36881 RepID=A0AAE0ERJ8_9CHLO|nr:hypothetical protein CYMTET_52230 [Cymbomonas tetramitiformis]